MEIIARNMDGENNISNAGRAEVLVQALPYIKRYAGCTIVVKYGGNAMINDGLKHQVMQDVVLLNAIGIKVVLVHGGGPEISQMLTRVGKKSEFLDGLRVTDGESMEIVEMVLAGKVNKSLVGLLEHYGGRAVGISGMDAGLIEADFKDRKYGYVGKVVSVNPVIIRDLLEKGYIPVVSTIGFNKNGEIFNINADTATAYIAGSLGADRMIMMTDVPGILKDKDDRGTLIQELTVEQAGELKEKGIISQGMIPKVECCVTAIGAGVQNVVIMDGTIPHSILMELLTDEGAGTLIRKGTV